MMISSDMVNKILDRLTDLNFDASAYQLDNVDVINNQEDGMNREYFAIGEYRSQTSFSLGKERELLSQPLLSRTDGNGSTFMGLWFLSQTHKIITQLLLEDTATSGLSAAQQGMLRDVAEGIHTQLQTASELPRFFQGVTQDVLNCPEGTMGWWPLVDGMRLPAVIPHELHELLGEMQKEDMANNSDGDIWSWCMAIDDTTPGILQYEYGQDALNDPSQYAPLLGPSFMEGAEGKEGVVLDDAAKALIAKVSPDGSARPIGTFYASQLPPAYPQKHPQRLSCAVMANILSSIPLVDEGLEENLEGIKEAIAFLQQATQMVLDGELEVFEYTYDYDTIPGCVFAYVARAHKRIIEIDKEGFPHLLTPVLAQGIADYLRDIAVNLLHTSDADLATEKYAGEYASLIYCFNGLMNLRVYHSTLSEQELIDRLATKLLVINTTIQDTPGTGPYKLFDIGPLTALWTSMASVGFVVPPLMEAYTLYLTHEASRSTL